MRTDIVSENRPIFIVGSYRSGTSVATWSLGQHPNILQLPETYWIARLSVDMDYLFKLGTANGVYTHLGALDWKHHEFYSEFGRFIDQFVLSTREPRKQAIGKYLDNVLTESAVDEGDQPSEIKKRNLHSDNYQLERSDTDPKGRWVDGTPENTFYMYSLSKMFPMAKFIHLLRNPLEVVASLSNFSNAGVTGKDYPIPKAFAIWLRFVNHAVLAEKALGSDKVLRVHFHDLTKNKESTIRKIFEFIEDDYHPDCMLPLMDKINSSKIEETMDRTEEIVKHGAEAEKVYNEICASNGPDIEPDQGALELLEAHFRNYAEALQRK